MNYNDPFDGTENPLATGWSGCTGVEHEMREGSGFGYGSGSYMSGSYYDGTGPGEHQKTTLVFDSTGGSGGYGGPGIRYDSGSGNAYFIETGASGGATWKKVTGGSIGTLGSGSSMTALSAGDSFDAEGDGTSLTAHKNGSSVETETDASYATGTGCFYHWGDYGSNFLYWREITITDEFGGGGATNAGWYSDKGGWW